MGWVIAAVIIGAVAAGIVLFRRRRDVQGAQQGAQPEHDDDVAAHAEGLPIPKRDTGTTSLMLCPCCGAPVPSGAMYCLNCGYPIHWENASSGAPSPAASRPADAPAPQARQATPRRSMAKRPTRSIEGGPSSKEPSGSGFDETADASVAVPSSEPAAPEMRKVEFSAVAPKGLQKGDYAVIDVVMYEPSHRQVVDDLISRADEPMQEARSGIHEVRDGSSVTVALESPSVVIDDGVETATWCGGHLDFSFFVSVPEDYKRRQVPFVATVYVNDVIATKLKFIVRCQEGDSQRVAVTRQDVLSAFVSYASQDRSRVAAIVQGMEKARPDLDVFFDVDTLRSGDDWEQALRREIQRRDVLFLCWSHFARDSQWVDAEWRYAFEQKGLGGIEPVPLEPPDVCPPPKELVGKHFNDRLLYIMRS